MLWSHTITREALHPADYVAAEVQNVAPPSFVSNSSPPVAPPSLEISTPLNHQQPADPIILPTALSDSDILYSLDRLYRSGNANKAELRLNIALLQTDIGRITAQWMSLRNQPTMPFQDYITFQTAYSDWPLGTALTRKAEVNLVTGLAPDDVKQAYFARKTPQTTTGKLYWAQKLRLAGATETIEGLIRPIWRTERLLKTTEQQVFEQFSALLTREDHRTRMLALMAGKNWEAALRAARYVSDDLEAIAKVRIAVLQNSKTALAQIEALSKDKQADPLILHSRLMLLTQQKRYKEAAALINTFIQTPASTPFQALSERECRDWQEQQRITARTLLDESAFEEAYKAAAAQLSKRGCHHSDAEFLAGWIAFRFLGNLNKAVPHFTALASNASTSTQKARAAYWLARVADARLDQEAAKANYQRAAKEWNTFYGQLAAEKLAETNFPTFEFSTLEEESTKFQKTTIFQAIKLLSDGGMIDLATILYADLANSLTEKVQFDALSQLAATQNNAQASLIIARIASRKGIDLGSAAYPTFGLPSVQPEMSNVEPALVYAIAHQESAFNPKAKSSAGALGLMQLMPETARSTANRRELSFSPERLTLDPEYNVALGAAHLQDLLKDWKGSKLLSFAAYNAGGGNVKKWITAHGDPRLPDVDVVDWIERIPFYETRHYVQRIAENLMIYRRLIGSSEPSLFAKEINTAPVKEPLNQQESKQ